MAKYRPEHLKEDSKDRNEVIEAGIRLAKVAARICIAEIIREVF